jgi:hypothetical protein
MVRNAIGLLEEIQSRLQEGRSVPIGAKEVQEYIKKFKSILPGEMSRSLDQYIQYEEPNVDVLSSESSSSPVEQNVEPAVSSAILDSDDSREERNRLVEESAYDLSISRDSSGLAEFGELKSPSSRYSLPFFGPTSNGEVVLPSTEFQRIKESSANAASAASSRRRADIEVLKGGGRSSSYLFPWLKDMTQGENDSGSRSSNNEKYDRRNAVEVILGN